MLILDDKHQYFVEGKRVPGVSEICRMLAPRFFTDEYFLNRGRIIHLLTEYEDNNELLEESVDPALFGYFQAYRKMKSETGFKIHKTELQFHSKKYGYCGRIDKYGELFGYMGVLDVKSGAPHEADQYQAPAYLFGLKDNKLPCWRAWDLYLKTNGTYRLEEVKNPTTLFFKFLEGLKQWKEE